MATAFPVSLSFGVDIEAVIAVARIAGERILSIYEGERDNWQVEQKSDDSPLTRADKEANALICAELARIAPHIPIVSEENTAVPFEVRKSYQYFWCVDPLDGTKEFIKRNGQFTVNIALLRGAVPVLGVVHTPCTDRTHWAAEGRGAYVREAGASADVRLHCAEFSDSDEGLVIVGSASHNTPETDSFVSDYKEPKFIALGSSLKLLLVAEGKAHLYPRLAPTCEWDTAASHVVVTEAGGTVVRAGQCDSKGKLLPGVDWRAELTKQDPVIYNKENPLNPFFVVYGKRRAAAL